MTHYKPCKRCKSDRNKYFVDGRSDGYCDTCARLRIRLGIVGIEDVMNRNKSNNLKKLPSGKSSIE